MLRDTAGEKVRMFLSCCIETLSDCNEIRNVLYSSSAHECAIGEVSRSDGGVGFYQKSIQLFLTPLRRKLSFLPFNPSPRRYAPLFLPYILRCKTQGRRNNTNSRNKIGYSPLHQPFPRSITGCPHRSEQRRSWNTSRPFLLCLIEGSL